MNTKKIILILIVFSLVIAAWAFSEQGNKVAGKVKVLTDSDDYAWVEFKADGGEDDQPASGFFICRQADESKETCVEVVYLKVDGKYAWFAGKCTKDSSDLGMMGRWLFLAARDGGTPGKLVDHLWWEWLPNTKDAENIAKEKVENFEKPANNKPIESGDIVIHY